MSVTVKTQAELDKALAGMATQILIDSPRGVWLTICDTDSASVDVCDSASVDVCGSASVDVCGSASVRAYGSASVEVYDSASVVAYGSGSASVVASKYTAVHLHSQRATLTGGVVIDMTAIDKTVTADWLDLTGAKVTHGKIRVYKAVNTVLNSYHGAAYPVGEHVTDTKWRDNHDCGGGLHFSPTPHQAHQHFRRAKRYLACDVLLTEVRCIDATKLKAPQCWVVGEVDIHGRTIAVAATT